MEDSLTLILDSAATTEPIGAPPATPFPLADIYRMRLITEAAVSPVGARIAYVVYGYREKENTSYTNLWLTAASGDGPALPLTHGDTHDNAPAWSPDGKLLAFLSTRNDQPSLTTDETKDSPKQQLWLFDLAGGEPRQLTNRPEGVAAFDWAPDSARLVFAARDPSPAASDYLKSIQGKLDGAGGESGPYVITRSQHKWDGVGYLDNVKTHLFTVGLTGAKEERLTDGPCDEQEPRWSPTGDWIAFTSNRTGDADANRRTDLWLIAPDGGEARRLTLGDLDVSSPRWSPDGQSLAFISRDDVDEWGFGTPRLQVVALAQAVPIADLTAVIGEGWSTIGGVIPAQVSGDPVQHARVDPVALATTPRQTLTAGLDRGVGSAPVWLSDDELLIVVNDRARARLARVTRGGVVTILFPVSTSQASLAETGDEQATLHGLEAAGGTVALIVNRPHTGTDLWTLPVETLADAATMRQLTQLNDAVVADRAPVTYVEIEYANSDGEPIHAVVIQPPGFDPAAGPAPLILHPHGGPMAYDVPALEFYPNFFTGDAYLAGQGYLVLRPNYRGSTSFGEAFTGVIRGRFGPREYDDCISGVDDLIARGWADPDRLFVTGVSYGGFLTSWVTGSTDRFKAAAPDLPAWDFGQMIGSGDLHFFLERDYGLYWQNPEAYRAASPSSLVLNTTTPSLIMAGQADWRCPPVVAEAYYLALRRIGVPTELIIYQNDHHAYTRPRRAIDRLIRIMTWFAAYGGLPMTDDSATGYPNQG